MIVGIKEKPSWTSDAMHKPFQPLRFLSKKRLVSLFTEIHAYLLHLTPRFVNIEKVQTSVLQPVPAKRILNHIAPILTFKKSIIVPAKSDSLPHAHTQAFNVNHSASRLLILNFLIVKELKMKDLMYSKSKDEGSRSRSQSMKEESHYKQEKMKTTPKKAKLKSQITSSTLREIKVKSRYPPTRKSPVEQKDKSLPFLKVIKKHVEKTKFIWTEKDEDAFQSLKVFLTKLPTLIAPFPSETLRMYLVSSNEACRTIEGEG
ncbi:hypothetical protein Tco_0694017 [Tanacetum coccineum]